MARRNALLCALLLAAPAALAQGGVRIEAAPVASPVVVDGRLDEPAWAAATPADALVQIFPGDGVAPGFRTEVRVLVGDRRLLVGIRCEQRGVEPLRPLGRRDHPPPSDAVSVLVDAANDRRSALRFTVTAGGVQSDAIVYDDDQVSLDWDGAWESAVTVDAEGWTAELAIPLALLPREPGARTWGFGVVREVAATHERMATFPVPRATGGMVGRLGALGGVDAEAARAALQLTPYAAQRLVLRPQYSDPARPTPRLLDASTDVGLDLRAATSRATWTATLNPDFGQVEADQIVLNLTNYETYFPEKRPFFTEGAEAFQSVGAGREAVPQRLVYSRRIGLDVPIFAAAKVISRPADGLQLAFLDAVVASAGQGPGASESAPDRRLRWHPERPLHVGTGDALPAVAPATQNYLAGAAHLRVRDGLVFGAQATAATPLASPCTAEEDARETGRPGSCDAVGGEALALDFNATSADGAWYAYGQAAGSRASGGPPERTLRDGTVLRRGDLGGGVYLRAGKRGGEPLRFDLAWTQAAPRLDLNASGFQRTQNEQEGRATIRLVTTTLRPFHEARVYLTGYARGSTDGRGLPTGRGAEAGFYAVLGDPWLTMNCWAQLDDPRWDLREISGSGIPFGRAPSTSVTCEVSTDESRALHVDLYGYVGRNRAQAGLGGPAFHGANAALALRPHPRLETRLELNYDRFAWPARYVSRAGDELAFAELAAPTWSATFRQLVAPAPRLTLQLYAQLFVAAERRGPWYAATARGQAPIAPGDLRPAPAPAGGGDARSVELVVNAVLAWESSPGSTLYLVYARDQAAGPPAPGSPPGSSLAPTGLAGGPTTDSLLLKWSWRLGG